MIGIIKRKVLKYGVFSLLSFVLITGCKPTRLLTDDEYLLQRNKIEIDSKSIDKQELEGYYRQKPNRRTLVIFKLPLAAYNFSKIGKERKWKNWVGRVIGEPPSIYDSLLVERTGQQFSRYLKNEAYYNSIVSYETKFKRKRAKVTYKIIPNKPIFINETDYQINDSLIAPIILADTSNKVLQKMQLFTLKSLQNERSRIVKQMQDSGYFYFNEDNIKYLVDTFNYKANIEIVVEKATIYDNQNNPSEINHRKYWVNDVFVYPDFNPQEAIRNREKYFSTFDTTTHGMFNIIFPGAQNVRPRVVLKANSIYPGNRYSLSNVQSSSKYLNSLKLFRLNNINFSPLPDNDSLLNCNIQLTPATYQNFSINFETTNAQGNYGLGGYLNYQHKNLFKGAEILNIKISGSFQRQNESKTQEGEVIEGYNIYEYGIVAGLETPSFLLPFKMERFYRKFNPKTTFSAVLNAQQKPGYYDRNIYGISMGYKWKGSKNISHIVSPLDISAVNIEFDPNGNFKDTIQNTYLANSFKDYFIAGGNYSFIYQNKGRNNKYSSTYLRWNVGVAGNLLHLFHNSISNRDTVDGGYYEILDLQYAHYGLTDIDFRHYGHLNKDQLIAYRFFAGLAFPIPNGNSNAVPFIKQYQAGGAQGIRAWQVYTLGPGTYAAPADVYSTQTADIKLETNVEFRFSFTRSWKGALFVDAGNIWSIGDEEDRPGALFKANEFYKQIALGTGFGLRYDLKFAVIRLDWGIKVKDPTIKGDQSWVLFNKRFEPLNDISWHFAIGYPF